MRLHDEVRAAVARVLTSPPRLRYLLDHGLGDVVTLARFLTQVVPLAERQIAEFGALAERIPDERIRALARETLDRKGFHVAGACVLATFLPPGAREHYVEIVAPLESIYDFLDSICDRHPAIAPEAFRPLHEALLDAVDPERPLQSYYRAGPEGDDGDYLAALVRRTRRALARLSDYEALLPHLHDAVERYADHQSYKHLPAGERAAALEGWARAAGAAYPELRWWEYAAACGSQFHVYAPLYAAFCSDLPQAERAYHAYFPAFSALHVLLDAFIDRDEDRRHGELNWVQLYRDPIEFIARARHLTALARKGLPQLPEPSYHRFALRIMTLFYATHPKVFAQGLDPEASALLRALC